MNISNYEFVVMPFGRHKGRTIDYIASKDFSYLKWTLQNVELYGVVADVVSFYVNEREAMEKYHEEELLYRYSNE